MSSVFWLLSCARSVSNCSNACVQGTAASGRAIARILHGLHSPAFPVDIWSKCSYWGRYANMDFSQVLETAEVEARAQ